ncbi:MarR family winged helix-turn-helix transcriptional regulator [Patulibacter defluvii]|uniref:MarR family winged helix-turn-helix transcriptional regulator n=1 Tax=Patulibacter defluvii TaxID=3095358 RepID=UPI002A757F72|nr:MarR family transcriptional regulator [Patulibacter sp. DM4]
MDTPAPASAPPPSTGELIARVARWVHGSTRERLAPLGVTPAAARALGVLMRSDEPLRMVELAERLRIVPRSVTTLVDGLEQDGLVERRPDPQDRRSTRVHLTEAGQARRDALRRARYEAADELVAVLSDDDREQLHRLLAIIDQAAHEAWCARRC